MERIGDGGKDEEEKVSGIGKNGGEIGELEAEESSLSKEYAVRVAEVMRRCLGRGGRGEEGSGGSASGSPRGGLVSGSKDRCKVFMEVVRRKYDKWVVTKVESEHNHEIEKKSEGEKGILKPEVGMEFESAEAAKVFYSNFGEKLGFKTRTGLNRRSAASGALTMQRFVCYKGNYINSSSSSNKGFIGLRKKVDEDGPVAKRTRGKKGKFDVTELQSSEEEKEEKDETESDYEVEGSSSKGKKGKKRGRKPKRVDGSDENNTVPKNSSLLYRLVRVPHNNNVERRRILLKYLNKRRNRGLFERPKIASRQIAAQGRKRLGGRFITTESTPTQKIPKRQYIKRQKEGSSGGQASVPAYQLMYWPVYSYQGLANAGTTTPTKSKPQSQPRPVPTYKDSETPEPDPTTLITAAFGTEPKLGMVFESEEKAHEFYSKYATKIGFTIRKGWWDRANRSVTKSRSFVCSKEGYRPRSVGSSNPKRPPPETRTNCGAHMTIKITVSGKYVVKEFAGEHNHELEPLLMDIQMLRRNNLLKKVVKKPKEGNNNKGKEIVVREKGDLESEEKEFEASVYIPPHYRNYVRGGKRSEVPAGDAGMICEYLGNMKGRNPSFFYAIQLDESDQLMNVFWTDSRSMSDYHYFGDVVCFDTRYKIENYSRPLALFLGVNHHRQIVIFGSALLYDESKDSIKWLFETFKSAMCEKQPKTVLTDQGEALTEAVPAVWPGSAHRFSVLHIYQNATRVLEHVFRGNEGFAGDFVRCLYGCEEETELVSSWDLLLEKYDLKENDWLKNLYTEKEKWSSVYEKQRPVFTGDILTALQNDNPSVNLMEYLKPEINISVFFKQFEQFVEEKRFSERQADSQGPNRVQNIKVLWQANSVYTPSVFELFQIEFNLFLTCVVYPCSDNGTVSEYEVTVKDKQRGHIVRFDASDLSVICMCGKFESVGIPCCHVLKIYDFKNMKDLPPQYVLKRWRKDAKVENNSRENHVLGLDENLKLGNRYGSLLRVLYRVAERASENQEAFEFMEGQIEPLIEQVERILQARVLDKGKGGVERVLAIGGEGTSGETKRKKKSRKSSANNNTNNNLNGGVGESSGGGKRKRARQGVSEETQMAIRADDTQPPTGEITPAPSRNPNHFLTPSHLMQTPYVPTPQQYNLSAMQGFHGMTQFNQMQDSSASLQHQAFHSSTQMTQAIPPAPDMQSLQFLGNPPLVGTNQQMVGTNQQMVGTNQQMVGTNQQLGHQNADQTNYTIPVWDFL